MYGDSNSFSLIGCRKTIFTKTFGVGVGLGKGNGGGGGGGGVQFCFSVGIFCYTTFKIFKFWNILGCFFLS